MLAFVNTVIDKPTILKQLRAHAAADEIIKGTYWENGKGCAVGCTIHSARHAEYVPLFGIPEMLARLEDCTFEGLPPNKAKKWPIRFMEVVEPGSDLACVGWQFLHWLLTDSEVNPGIDDPTVKDAVRACADVLVPLTRGNPLDASAAESAAQNAERAAESAARSAATAASAAWSAAESAAYAAWSAAESASIAAASAAAAAARSAERSAESAAWSAERVSWSAARSAAYVMMSDKLVELIEAAPKGVQIDA